MHRRSPLLFALLFASLALNAQQSSRPKGAAKASAQAAQGSAPTITLAVDASEAPRKIFHARMTIPAKSGPFTVYYPQWLPGEHGPTGPVVDTAGLRFTAAGKTLPWRRDTLDMFTYHVEIPQGANTVEVAMDYMSPTEMPGGFSSGTSATAQMAVLSWNWMVLYPKGWGSDQVQVRASLRMPAGWKFGTALPVANRGGDVVDFAPASLTTLVDSPVIMGAHLSTVPLSQGQNPPHEMDIAADSEAALQMTKEQNQGFNNLVSEAGALFGARHYRDYHFLLSLSDHVAHFGLEHHESNDSRLPERFMVDETQRVLGASLLPHEYVHSWNGKYRRPADLATPEYQTPMQSELLWVYEGLTEYLGYVLTARSGLWTPEQFRDQMAIVAEEFTHRPGRQWRSLEDTATAAQSLYGAGGPWTSWRRSVDFYDEGALIWLEADVIIRQQTGNKKSMDDFAHLFHGGQNSGPMVRTYTFDDVVSTLNQVAPYDWRKFLTDRIINIAPNAPLGGIEGGGWRVVYTDTPSDLTKAHETSGKALDASASIGLLLKEDGKVSDAIHDMISAKAGIGPGMSVVAVNGRKFSPDVMRDALKASKNSREPLQLLIENAEYFKAVSLDYHDGLRYPHLVRDSSKPDFIGDIIKPKVTTPPEPEPKPSE